MPKKKQLLFSLTKKDFKVEFFRAGGKGGQKQNKTSSACRIKHSASGAVGESREERYQHMNRKIAFKRLADSKKFRSWVKMHSAVVMQGFRDVESKVDSMLKSDNLRIEFTDTYTCDGCGRSEQIVADVPGVLPDWVAVVDEKKDQHFCTECGE